MRIDKVIQRQTMKSGGQIRTKKIPSRMRPTAMDFARLEKKIASQVESNETVSNRSLLYASRRIIK